MHHPTNRIVYTIAFITPVVWVHHDSLHHEHDLNKKYRLICDLYLLLLLYYYYYIVFIIIIIIIIIIIYVCLYLCAYL